MKKKFFFSNSNPHPTMNCPKYKMPTGILTEEKSIDLTTSLILAFMGKISITNITFLKFEGRGFETMSVMEDVRTEIKNLVKKFSPKKELPFETLRQEVRATVKESWIKDFFSKHYFSVKMRNMAITLLLTSFYGPPLASAH